MHVDMFFMQTWYLNQNFPPLTSCKDIIRKKKSFNYEKDPPSYMKASCFRQHTDRIMRAKPCSDIERGREFWPWGRQTLLSFHFPASMQLVKLKAERGKIKEPGDQTVMQEDTSSWGCCPLVTRPEGSHGGSVQAWSVRIRSSKAQGDSSCQERCVELLGKLMGE